ncbi:MAG: 50S ribosomal protein L1 [Patescibacteria group bacterium]
MAQRKVTEIASEEIIDEKSILKQAEEREKERKEQEKVEKEENKQEEKKVTQHGSSRAESRELSKKVQIRKKPRHGKNHRKVSELIEKDKEYPTDEAIELALKTSTVKFDATVEIHVKINGKEKNIRGTVTLPGGVAKMKKAVGITEKNVDEMIEKIKANKLEFDILVADLKVMPKLAVLAKLLGPKGLMPSPKAGTAVEDVDKAIAELEGGKVEFRADKDNIVHLAIGKISFGAEKIRENYDALLAHLPKRIDSIHLATTMGPSIKVLKK